MALKEKKVSLFKLPDWFNKKYHVDLPAEKKIIEDDIKKLKCSDDGE